MDELLYLEPDEEITSVIDKLKGLPGDTVALVLPKRAQLAASIVNLKLLRREAKRLNKQISLVTQDRVGTSLAGQVGIPVFRSVGDEEPVAVPRGPLPRADDVLEINASPTNDDADDDEAGIPVHRYDSSKNSNHESRITSHETSRTVQTAHSSRLTVGQAQLTAHSEEHDQPDETASITPTQSSTQHSKGPIIRRGPVLIVLAVLLGAALGWFFFIYPRATVVLAIASEPVSQTVTVTIDNNINDPLSGEARIPGQKVQVETSVKSTAQATGSKEVGTKANGTVTVSNRLGETVALPGGSLLSRDGRDFLTKEAIEINAATVSLDSAGNVLVKPGTKTVAVEAKEVGSVFNLAAGDFLITSLSGTKRDRVTASNSSAFAGGDSHSVKVVTENDIKSAKESVGSSKTAELSNQLTAQAKDITVLASTIEVDVIEVSTSKNAGDETDTFDVEAKIRARTIGFVAAQYQQAIVEAVGKTLPPGKELMVSAADSVETKVGSSAFDQGTLELVGTLRASMVQTIDESALRQLIKGKTSLAAAELLKTQSGIIDAEVQLRPALRQAVPKSDSQIIFQINRQ